MSEIEAIEAATRAALVAEEHEIDGWWLRNNPELPNRRPNSATTPPHGRIAPAVVDDITGWYALRGRSPVIRVLSTSDADFDRHLEKTGWTAESTTRVMALQELPDHDTTVDVRIQEGGDGPPVEFVHLRSRVGLSATAAELTHDGSELDSLYALAPAVGEPVATGRALLVTDKVGIYDVVTLPDDRRRGWGSAAVRALLAAARDRGMATAFLQVEEDNAAATRMYESLGFMTVYTYHYRRRLETL